MAYIKIMYQNSPSTATPINAENLNHMDDQIALNDQRLTEIETSYVKSFNGRKGDVVPEDGDYNIGQIAPLTGAQVGQVPVVTNIGTEEDPELVFRMGAGGGGGHSIIDSEGNTMPQETAMQFADSFVSDDETNGITIVENVKELTLAELSQATERGMYLATDEESVPIPPTEEDVVSVTADGVKTYGQLLNELYALIDENRLSKGNSFVEFNNAIFHYMWNQDGNKILNFTLSFVTDLHTNLQTIVISSASRYSDSSDGNITDYTNTVATSGAVITLHYGTSSGIVELNTDARNCMMLNGHSVEWGMGEKTTLCTMMSAETVINMTQASVNYAVQHDGFYSITVVNANNVTHDSDINIGGVAIASQYLTYHYQRYTALIPLKAGTQITINGASGDGVIINYGWGNI